MAIRFNPARHAYGTKWEQTLKPLLETVLEEPLTKTKQTYDLMDFTSDSFFVELKCRSPIYHPEDFKTWVIPSCKIREASKHPDKKTIFFYYFSSTDQLFMIEYNEEIFNTFTQAVPSWHADKQEHHFCPAEEFTYVEFV